MLGPFVLNMLTAVLLGLVIGFERQWRQHTAGLRTNALVSLGAMLFVSISAQLGSDPTQSNVVGQVVTGIGFLGGGVILREGLTVRGLNTAATLWCTAAIGALSGSGCREAAFLGAFAILTLNVVLRPLVYRIELHTKTAPDGEAVYRFRVVCQADNDGIIRTIIMRHVGSQPRMALQGIAVHEADDADRSTVVAEIFSAERNDKYLNELVSRISIEPGVNAVSWDRAT